jgi:tetratricopeptide (TPR) repeat protein
MDNFFSKLTTDKFFTKLDWGAFWTATLITFAVYFYTLGPSVGLEDSGELATAGAHLGVPHPPGYPFWTLCSWIFCKVFFWVTYMGHPTPAWCISLFSATAGAFAAGFTAMLICASSRDFLNDAGGKWLCFGGGVAGALTFSLSPVEWSQSTIVEIYSLNAFFLMWVFLLSYRWMSQPSDKILWFTAFVFGLGLTNYQVLLFAIVPLALIILMRNLGLFRDVFVYLIPVALAYQVLQVGCLLQANANMQSDVINKHVPVLKAASCPSSAVLAVAVVALVAAVVVAAVQMRRGQNEKARTAALAGGGFGAVLMLLASTVFVGPNAWTGITEAVAPLIDPRIYAVIGAFVAGSVALAVAAACCDEERLWKGRALPYFIGSAVLALVAVVVASNVPQAGSLGYLGKAYPWGKSTLVFWSLIAVLFALTSFTKKGLAFAVPVAGLHIAAFVLLRHGAMNGLTHPSSWWFCWPIAWNFILLALAWTTLPNGRSVAGAAFFAQLGVSFYVYMPIVSELRNPPMNWGYPRTWEGFKHAIMRGQYEAIGVPSFASAGEFFSFMGRQMMHYFGDVKLQFTDLLIPFAAVPFAAGHWVVTKDHKKTFWQWMGAAFACFFMMSFLLILLANVKGDIQDGFIQKVKFISSHAMIALWIGYGLVFATALLRRWIPAALLAVAMILVAAVYPIVQNYTDDQMVFELGGNEQNGHTFGWQFGAYQLDGAKAIKEQLVADEEPLPDPDWPEAMEPFSIFFGGTDPGRFVPTYMIYSADFRPDVYLITQNALADGTYMAVERDLYGDEIWIPSSDDSAKAFEIYVDEVRRGIRPANGDLRIENGRVQVTGALGVMEINGILTKMMFDHDRLRHSFYVEESYVIPWMYPYLSPHGLIMKINRDPTPYDPKTAAKDRDFWDWYVRRLLNDPMYRRDFAGQKSFSKLRAAIAGLYAKQGRRAESAQAYREACLLYPASPEASFRYAQEILLPERKWDHVLELMDYTDKIDPKNKRTEGLRGDVVNFRTLLSEAQRLEPKLFENRITKEEKFSLACCYSQLGRIPQAAQLLKDLSDLLRSPAELETAATVFLSARMDAEAEKTLNRLLKAEPDTRPDMWLELAKIQFRTMRKQASVFSFNQAVRISGEHVQKRMGTEDPELMEIYRLWTKFVESQQQRNWRK